MHQLMEGLLLTDRARTAKLLLEDEGGQLCSRCSTG